MVASNTVKNYLPRSFYKSLISILREEIALLESLKQNLSQQRATLLTHDISAFLKVLEEQQLLIAETEAKSKARESVLKTYLHNPAEFRLSQIISEGPEEFKSTLTRLKADFNRLIKQINQYRDSNRALIEKSLKFLDKHLSRLQRFRSYGYEKNGEMSVTKDSNLNKQV
ncbi:hypothetical protein DRQ12_10195 [candidate division KSB1 bacterium]|nr:MAG: hypothetical protein DRQ12_10195 [candidate division KSB1 bacterium]